VLTPSHTTEPPPPTLPTPSRGPPLDATTVAEPGPAPQVCATASARSESDAHASLGYAGGPSGIAPSCCIIDNISMSPQCSRTTPASLNCMMSMNFTSMRLPLGGMPINSPW